MMAASIHLIAGRSVDEGTKSREGALGEGTLSGGGGGGTSDGMEARVKALEDGQKEILSELKGLTKLIADWRLETEKRFGAIEGRLTSIDVKLDTKASAAELNKLDGRVASIPTTWHTVAIIAGFLVGIGTISIGVAKLLHP